MKFERFELSVIELASQGVCITVPNVAAHLHVQPTKAEEWLDRMAYEGRLDVELEETQGYIYYRVRGLSPTPTAMVVRPEMRPMRGTKSPGWAAALGLFLPGFGLLYAAPLSVALLGGLLVLAGVNMAAAFPLLGPLLSSIVLAVAALTSAILGAEYAKRYNEYGRRTHLGKGELQRHATRWPNSAAQAVQNAVRQPY